MPSHSLGKLANPYNLSPMSNGSETLIDHSLLHLPPPLTFLAAQNPSLTMTGAIVKWFLVHRAVSAQLTVTVLLLWLAAGVLNECVSD